jgi:hypothetical protein
VFFGLAAKVTSVASKSIAFKGLFTEHFGDNEDNEGAADAASEKKIDKRITDGTDHWYKCCDHHGLNPPELIFLLQSSIHVMAAFRNKQ